MDPYAALKSHHSRGHSPSELREAYGTTAPVASSGVVDTERTARISWTTRLVLQRLTGRRSDLVPELERAGSGLVLVELVKRLRVSDEDVLGGSSIP